MRRLLLFLLVLAPSLVLASKADFAVKLPDGLYLYQPYAGDEVFAKGDKDTIRPLFIVEKGKLVDPFLRAQKMGLEKFMRKYVSGKTFNVYAGPELVGKLSDVEFATCSRGEFVPDLLGKGKYAGKSLPTVPSKYITNHAIHTGLKMVMAPVELRLGPAISPSSKKNASDTIESAQRMIAKSIGGNLAPNSIAGGTLDLDQDGSHELIVQRVIESNQVLGEAGIRIELYRRYNSAWKSVFHTASIGCP